MYERVLTTLQNTYDRIGMEKNARRRRNKVQAIRTPAYNGYSQVWQGSALHRLLQILQKKPLPFNKPPKF